jgi:PAS domain S-box-containing protein
VEPVTPVEIPGVARASVLIVDDRAANLLALEAILGPLGHRLVKAHSGEEALKQVLQKDFALVLLDVQMAGMSGFETAALMKQHPRSRQIPIIFISAISRDAEHVFKGYSQGAVDYLLKPFEPEILRSKAAVFIDLHLKGEMIKAQERLLREREREVIERKSMHRYRSLLDSMPQCVWAVSPSPGTGAPHYWNRAGLRYCGLVQREVSNESIWEVMHPEDRQGTRAAWEEAIGRGVPFEGQLRIRRADGAYRWHLGRVVPERNEQGESIGWIATATDVHDQKKSEEALQRAVLQRDDFLSVASHELRTPLTSLKLELSNLDRIAQRQGSVPPERLHEKLAKIGSQAERLHRLIDDLLDVSRIASGRLELDLEQIDLSRVALDTATRFQDEAARLGCALTISAPEKVSGRWDKNRLEQVITNLMSNALKYGEGKPVDLTVEAGQRARLSVRDHGIGISPADQSRIFERFERATSTRNFGGIGLGLWIVKEIVAALDGDVRVESDVGAGATFIVELPYAGPRAGAGAELPLGPRSLAEH